MGFDSAVAEATGDSEGIEVEAVREVTADSSSRLAFCSPLDGATDVLWSNVEDPAGVSCFGVTSISPSTWAPSGRASAASLEGRATESVASINACLFRRRLDAFEGKVSFGTEYQGSFEGVSKHDGGAVFMAKSEVRTQRSILTEG